MVTTSPKRINTKQKAPVAVTLEKKKRRKETKHDVNIDFKNRDSIQQGFNNMFPDKKGVEIDLQNQLQSIAHNFKWETLTKFGYKLACSLELDPDPKLLSIKKKNVIRAFIELILSHIGDKEKEVDAVAVHATKN